MSVNENYTIRICNTFEDYEKCIELQRKVWHLRDIDITPLRIYVISQNAGGFTLGAFSSEGEMIGFLHTLPAVGERREFIYYSHMLAIVPEMQNSGLGREMKLRQRERALENRVPYLIWTFDPLQSRNAHLNINKLGCIIRRYKINFYSSSMASVFDANVESDRLMAEWWISSPRVEAAIAGRRPDFPPDAPFVEVPYDIASVRAHNLDAVREWRNKTREQFQSVFGRGLVCTGFEPGSEERLSRYYFTPWQSE
jgi:predicted GNAT superfamily acetyltransferase